CACGLRGCWEQYGSGRVLDRWAQQHLVGSTPVAKLLIAKAGSAEQVTGKTVSQLAADGIREARECLATVGYNLGVGMASLAAVFDPEFFVVGGGLADNKELLLEPMVQSFEEHLFGAAHRKVPPIKLALLGPDAALIGAAGLAPR
ncbi:MAG: ROK family protein, partial [Actinomycetales bacterium]|nr:ROK family protein [Actinomycetales bacterium]